MCVLIITNFVILAYYLEEDVGEVRVTDPHILERKPVVMLLALQSVHRKQRDSLLRRHVEIRLQTVQHLTQRRSHIQWND